MKFACFVLTIAPPWVAPLRPAASISRPAWSPSGLRKIEPVFGCASGCFAIRSFAISLMRFTAVARSPGFPRKRALTTTIGVFCRLVVRSEEHTSELQSLAYLVCRLLLEKKKNKTQLPRHLLV